MKVLLFVLSVTVLTSCTGLQTRTGRFDGVSAQEASLDFRRERVLEEYQIARNELGLSNVELTDDHKRLIVQRVELKRLERDLRSETAKHQYYQYKPYIRGDQSRINFLKIPTVEKRELAARKRNWHRRLSQNSPFEKSAIEQNDIFIGMSKRGVRESWGDPEKIEVAGNTTYGNERWKYSTYVTTPDGFDQEERVVYFEGGRVVGWNLR